MTARAERDLLLGGGVAGRRRLANGTSGMPQTRGSCSREEA